MENLVQVIDADYRIENGGVTVRCFAKSDNGENVLFLDDDFLPYLYVIPGEDTDIRELRKKIDDTEFADEGEKLPVKNIERKQLKEGNQELEVLKVFTAVPPKIPKLKNELWDLAEVKECREFDIPFYKRYLIDKGIKPVSWIRIEGEEAESEDFDRKIIVENIETNLSEEDEIDWETLAFDLEVYQDRIIMASLYSEKSGKLITTEDIARDYVESVKSERQILERFIEIVRDQDIDILIGYNTDEYDFDVLRERAEEYGLELALGRDGEKMKFKRRGRFTAARLKGRMHLDLYPFISHVLSTGLESETLDLDSVAEEILGRNKEELSWEEMKQSWREKEDLDEFADYALKDSELAFELGEELAPQILELSRIVGLIPFDACRLTYGQLTENYLLREAHERDMLARNRPSQDERSKRRRQGAYSGGFVYTPEAGLYENISLFDFKSLYPTVMVSHNISPDTLNLEECDDRFELEEFDYDFCQDQEGFFPELVEELVKSRSEIKDRMRDMEKSDQKYESLDSRQRAQKILANSFYGYLGYNGARWYSRECAEATTYLGREYIQEAIDVAEEMGLEVTYGDTDSVFLRGYDIKDKREEFLDKVNSELPEFMQLEFEGFFETGFFTSTDSGEGAKKKYALMDEEGSMKITGFEQVRRDWAPIAKKTQKKVLEKVLEGQIDEATEIAKEVIEDLKDGDVPVEDLRIYTSLTKKPENYDSTAPHVEAAKKAIERGEDISPGSTISYVITRGGGSISNRAELLKYADSYDSEYYVENQVLPVVLRVLKVFGYTEGQLKGKGKQSGLDKFN
ncbi:DNA polymerase [Nanohaloarchaea archaeon H01]|nr:DNA polymerase [Nanohaloarchaea archaeon H01]